MLYIIRHGKTGMNSAHALQGRSDCLLNEEGVRQAEAAAAALSGVRFSRVFTSPLIRAVQTARIVAPYAEPECDGRLIEMDYGPYEGADLRNPPPEIVKFFSDFSRNPAPDGMEQLSSVVGRAGDFLESIRGLEGDILISTHAIAMKGILEYLTPGSEGSYWSRYIGNCAVYAAQNREGEYGIPYEIETEASGRSPANG